MIVFAAINFKLGKGRFCLYGEKLRSQPKRRPEEERRVSRQLSWLRGSITEERAQIEAQKRPGALSERVWSQVNLRRDENNLALGGERYARTHRFKVHQLLRTDPWMRDLSQGESWALLSPSAWIWKPEILIWSLTTTVFYLMGTHSGLCCMFTCISPE